MNGAAELVLQSHVKSSGRLGLVLMSHHQHIAEVAVSDGRLRSRFAELRPSCRPSITSDPALAVSGTTYGGRYARKPPGSRPAWRSNGCHADIDERAAGGVLHTRPDRSCRGRPGRHGQSRAAPSSAKLGFCTRISLETRVLYPCGVVPGIYERGHRRRLGSRFPEPRPSCRPSLTSDRVRVRHHLQRCR